MRRYNIGVAHTDGGIPVFPSRIAIEEQFNGEWVRYEDVNQFRSFLVRIVTLWRNPQLGGIDDTFIGEIEEWIE